MSEPENWIKNRHKIRSIFEDTKNHNSNSRILGHGQNIVTTRSRPGSYFEMQRFD